VCVYWTLGKSWGKGSITLLGKGNRERKKRLKRLRGDEKGEKKRRKGREYLIATERERMGKAV